MPYKLAQFAFAVVAVTTIAAVPGAVIAASLAPVVTIACPLQVKANTHPARDLPGWNQDIINGWLHSARYDKARHVAECLYGNGFNPQSNTLFTTLGRGVDRALVNCRVTADQKAVVCDRNEPKQAPTRQAPAQFRKQ